MSSTLLWHQHLPEETLMKLLSIAIWNKSKVIVGLATSVWLTNLSFLILGESLSISLDKLN